MENTMTPDQRKKMEAKHADADAFTNQLRASYMASLHPVDREAIRRCERLMRRGA